MNTVTRIQNVILGLLLPAILWAGSEFMRMRDAVGRQESQTVAMQSSIEAFKRELAAIREGDQREFRSQIEALNLRVARLEASRNQDDLETRQTRDILARLGAHVDTLNRRLEQIVPR